MQQFRNENGLVLAASTGGDPAHPPVVLLHGGGQTRHSWNNAFDALVTAGHYVISFDARGHGESDWDPRGDYTLDAMVADLHAILAHLSSPPVLVGASMGGLTALAAAGEAIAPIARALVLVDVTPRINAEGAEKIMTFMRSHVQGFESLDEAAQAVTDYLPHRPRQANSSGLSRNLRRRGNRWFWHWDPQLIPGSNLAHSQTQVRLEKAARSLTIPMLMIRGKQSDIVTEQEARRFIALAPAAEYLNVADAGHMVVGDRNDAFNTGILNFIGRLQSR